MALVRIFVDKVTGKGLYSFRFDDQKVSEYSRLLDIWTDAEEVKKYFARNAGYLNTPFFQKFKVDDANVIVKIAKEVQQLDDILYDYGNQDPNKEKIILQEIFRALEDEDYVLEIYQRTKTSVKNGIPLLRLYGVRMGPDTYVISGGAIKLTRKMKEHPDLIEEIKKIATVIKYLKDNGFENEDDFK